MNLLQEELDNLETNDDSKHMELLTEQLFKPSQLLKRLETTATTINEREASTTAGPMVSNIKNPPFDKNFMAWEEFNEIFNSFVHNNIRFNDVHKFIILKTHLDGEASQAVEGIPCTPGGYRLARSILNERFNQIDN